MIYYKQTVAQPFADLYRNSGDRLPREVLDYHYH